MTDDAERIAAIKDGDMGERSVAGSNEQLIEEMSKYIDLGFDEIIVPDFTLGSTAEARRDAYQKFAEEIAPHIG